MIAAANHQELRRITVYDGHGDAVVERVHVSTRATPPASRDVDELTVGHLMSNELVCASAELELVPLLELLSRRHIGCIPIVDRRGHALGIVTKTDLVEPLATMLNASKHPRCVLPKRARDVMMPLAISVTESATLAQVASLMVLEDIHHVLVVSDENYLVGIVSTMDLARWIVTSSRPTAS